MLKKVVSQKGTHSLSPGCASVARFAGALGASNLDVLGFVPIGCVFPDTDFYFHVLIKTVGPVCLIFLLWLYPGFYLVRRSPHGEATRFAAQYSLYLLELLLPSISTTLSQALVCTRFEDGWFLRAQLTIPCDDSPRRRGWILFSALMICAYPVGVPALLFCVMKYYSPRIKALQKAVEEHDRGSRMISSVAVVTNRKSRASFTGLSVELMHLVPKFERFTAEAWFTHIFLLVLRLAQTSLMALIPSQGIQACLACQFAIVGVVVLRELSPYRRPSE